MSLSNVTAVLFIFPIYSIPAVRSCPSKFSLNLCVGINSVFAPHLIQKPWVKAKDKVGLFSKTVVHELTVEPVPFETLSF